MNWNNVDPMMLVYLAFAIVALIAMWRFGGVVLAFLWSLITNPRTWVVILVVGLLTGFISGIANIGNIQIPFGQAGRIVGLDQVWSDVTGVFESAGNSVDQAFSPDANRNSSLATLSERMDLRDPSEQLPVLPAIIEGPIHRDEVTIWPQTVVITPTVGVTTTVAITTSEVITGTVLTFFREVDTAEQIVEITEEQVSYSLQMVMDSKLCSVGSACFEAFAVEVTPQELLERWARQAQVVGTEFAQCDALPNCNVSDDSRYEFSVFMAELARLAVEAGVPTDVTGIDIDGLLIQVQNFTFTVNSELLDKVAPVTFPINQTNLDAQTLRKQQELLKVQALINGRIDANGVLKVTSADVQSLGQMLYGTEDGPGIIAGLDQLQAMGEAGGLNIGQPAIPAIGQPGMGVLGLRTGTAVQVEAAYAQALAVIP